MSFVTRIGNATNVKPGLIQLAGDLTGTATNPQIARVNGVSISGTPASGYSLVATGASTAAWQPSGGNVPVGQLTGVVVENNGTYPARPTGFANVKFIGATDPGTLAQNGDEWVKLS
jgi:pectin methylesterase-like acyl-CoA thioesterase